MTPRATYLCYFSLHEPLVQTQVLPYLRAIVAGGVAVTLLTFEPAAADTDAVEKKAASLRADGIQWHRRRYHKRPSLPATLLDIGVGALFVRRQVRADAVDVVHARSHVPAAMAVLGMGRGPARPRFLFDVRGFMPEEYVDAGVWPANGALFRAMKAVEARVLRRADGLVVLTDRARAILTLAAPSVPIEVIPCCVDLATFPTPTPAAKAAAKQRLGVGGRRVLVYVGSTTGFYLFDEMVQFAVAAKGTDPSTFFLVLTQRDVDRVAEQIAAGGLARGDFAVKSVAPQEIAEHVVAADMALSFIPETYSKQASSPTKIAEYLACGVPVVATAGVGDIDSQITDQGIGVLIRSLSPEGYAEALTAVGSIVAAPDVAEKCRDAALRLFDLATVGAPRYVALYDELLRANRPALA